MKSVRRDPYPIHKSSSAIGTTDNKELDLFIGKPFYCGNDDLNITSDNLTCCFNHIIGLPIKNGIEHIIYDYELDTVKAIDNNMNVWIKKASGIGMTELILRFLRWKILFNDDLQFKNIFIVSGTFVHHAHELKERMENLFLKRFPLMTLESKFTDLWIRNTNIKIFPSRNVKDLRGYTDVSYLFIDEADYFEDSVNNELLHAITRYEEKSHCTTIMVSTPNKPNGLFQTIELDKNSKYHKIMLDYTVGLDKIYNRDEINRKKSEPEFRREYMGFYLGKIGNVFPPKLIDQTVKRYTDLGLNEIPVVHEAMHIVGIDPAFGSSNTAIVITEHLKNPDIVRVIFAREYEKANPQDIIDLCYNFHRKYYPNIKFIVDGSNAGFIRQMKVVFDEDPDYDYKDVSFDTMEIIPVNFSTDHKSMLSHLYMMINEGYLAIPQQYDKLIVSLRTAQANEYTLDKKQTSYDDSLDALRLSLQGYLIE
jgi:hypothetical protein